MKSNNIADQKNKDSTQKSTCTFSHGAKMATDGSIDTDPDGSWTGVPTQMCGDEMPIQDADDL